MNAPKFEYSCTTLLAWQGYYDERAKLLKEMSEQRWELVSVNYIPPDGIGMSHYDFIFKRPMQEPQ